MPKLGDMKDGAANARKVPVIISRNMGRQTIKKTLSIREFIDRSTVFNRDAIDEGHATKGSDAQRNLNEAHAKGLAQYILSGLVETVILARRRNQIKIPASVINLKEQLLNPPYAALQPIVCNIRQCEADGADLDIEYIEAIAEDGTKRRVEGVVNVTLFPKHIMSVVDGQHRRFAFKMVMDWLSKVDQNQRYPTKGLFNPTHGVSMGDYLPNEISELWSEVNNYALTESFVSIECHLGATVQEEQQLFSDLNSKGKKVDLATIHDYDRNDPVNLLVQELIENKVLQFPVIHKDISDWSDDEGGIPRKDLNTITSLLVLGKNSSKNSTPSQVNPKKDFVIKFWKTVQRVPGFGRKGAKKATVSAQPVVLKGIAKLAHELGYGKPSVRDESALATLWESLADKSLDLSHTNDAWRSLMLNAQEREKLLPGVGNFVHVPLGTNLDAGTYEPSTGWVRYGAKHNDIYRRIGDLIRYQLELSPRGEVTKAIEKETVESTKNKAA